MPVNGDRSRIVILVVDGEVMARNMTALMLHREGYTVMAAANGKEALDLSHTYDGQIDLLITEVGISKLDGLELCRTMRSERPQLKVLATSADSADGTRAAVERVPFLLKPLDAALLRGSFPDILT